MKLYLRLLAFLIILASPVAWYLYHNPEAREVALNALSMIVGFVFTPFILETTCFLVGCFVLSFILAKQRKQAHDEWVEIKVEDKSDL